MKTFKVLGSGCANCKTTAKLIEDMARERGSSVVVEKVEDIKDIMSYGVMSTPGVVIDGKLVHAGGIPDSSTVESWFSEETICAADKGEVIMFDLPDWTFEFHGHRCPFMPIGFRMGTLAMEKLGVGKSLNHEMHVFSEMGVGHPQGCMQDGIMSATGATFGKGMIDKLNYGKVAAVFWYPGKKDAVRIALKNEFQDTLSPHEFFKYRRKGVEPSDVPEEVRSDIINMALNATNDELFNVSILKAFDYAPVKGSFNKTKCESCGEYVFERYLRVRDDRRVCIPCSGRTTEEQLIHLPDITRGKDA